MIKLKSINKSFNIGKNNEIKVLKDISLSFPNTGLFIILGPSGSGKSTLLSLIGALDKPTSGEIYFDGQDITNFSDKEANIYREKYVSFIFQDNNLIDYLSLGDNAMLKSDDKQRKEEILRKLDIDSLAKKKPSTLSGGEKERCAIARAVISDSKVLLCDEPTASLDYQNAENVLSILKEISKTRLVIVVSHDEKLCRQYSDNIINIRDGVVEENIVEEEKPVEEVIKTSKVYRSGLVKKTVHHVKHKWKESTLIVFLSMVAFFCVSMIVALSNGTRQMVDRSVNELIHYSPLTISSYYENITSIDLLNNEQKEYEVGVNIDQKTNITASLHKNIITDDFVQYLTDSPAKDTYFSYNNDQSYSIIYENNGSYSLYDDQSVNSLNDYIESFFGKRSAINTLIYDEAYFKSKYQWLYGSYPKNDNEAILVYKQSNVVSEDVANLLGLKKGDNPEAALGKKIYIADHSKLYTVNETKSVSGHFLKDKEALKASNTDLKAINNYCIEYANAYYDGDISGQEAAQNKINSLFKDEVETKELKAYTKIQNSSTLKGLIDNNDVETITISGIAIVPDGTKFAEKNNGILIPANKLKAIRTKNSQSEIAEEIDNHIVLADSTDPINIPKIYGYLNIVKDFSSSSVEEYLLSYIDFFENRKFFSTNDEISSIEVYAPDMATKDYYANKIEAYNSSKEECYKMKYLDLSKKVVGYFDTYFSIIETALLIISISTLVVSGILSLVIIFNMVNSRIKEIGILRASGYSRGYIFSLIELEGFSLGTLSGCLGVAIANLIIPIVMHYLSLQDTELALENILNLSCGWSLIIIAIAMVVSFLAALVPSLLYSNKKPVDILKM